MVYLMVGMAILAVFGVWIGFGLLIELLITSDPLDSSRLPPVPTVVVIDIDIYNPTEGQRMPMIREALVTMNGAKLIGDERLLTLYVDRLKLLTALNKGNTLAEVDVWLKDQVK